MKPTMALKPLVFALAAVMAMTAQAGGSNNSDDGNDNDHCHHSDQPDPTTMLLEQLQVSAGSSATVIDSQYDNDYAILNEGTVKNADVECSADGSNGNMVVNVVGGDTNQQDNAAALSAADETFFFGSAVASSSATQANYNGVVNNSTQNTANQSNSANNGSNNIGINSTAGNVNQQKNNLAIAISGGRVAASSESANQTSDSSVVDNNAVQTYQTTTLSGSL